ncbi:undecaprenyl-phosphate glucose phosphotransferase [Parapedobacter defluvii]|uniref:Undecaprenyl-phosphate glucose phosphotransferase n=1 Tax=Parapedobacter defluvii TaxID=2045106 RepID=A0ABQ1MVL1_9SPHI|nr:undecaprenyl-phosphate glucose phosphotransferase [Parapedobacter defluvii]
MQTRYIFLLKFVLAFTDLLFLNTAFFAAGEITRLYFYANTEILYSYYLPVANLLWMLSGGMFRMYMQATMDSLENIYRATLRTAILHGVLFSVYLLLAHRQGVDASAFLFSFYVLLAILLVFSRLIGTYIQDLLLRHFHMRKTVAIMGKNEGGRKLANYFRAHERNYYFEGYLAENDDTLLTDSGEVTQAARKQFQRAIKKRIQEVYISLPSNRMLQAAALLEEADRNCLRVKLVPDLVRADNLPYEVSILGPVPVVSIRQEPVYDIESRFKKRLFDLVFSTLVIVMLLSWLYPIIALLIKLESRGPVLFKQQRTGRDNKPFWCYKFRSMRINTDSDNKQAKRGDRRITRVGAFLRRTSLDELPQFLNVLQGHMSVVGPRPHMLKHTEQYRELINQYMVRQFLKPGITGWAQVNGYRGETTDPRLMERRVAHDIWYLENWTAMLDVRIVFMTVINVITGEENAY